MSLSLCLFTVTGMQDKTSIQIANQLGENMTKLKYFGMTVKVKVKFSLEQGMRTHRGEQMYRSTLLSTSVLGGGRVVNATPRPLYPR